jgi:hypothetical protein
VAQIASFRSSTSAKSLAKKSDVFFPLILVKQFQSVPEKSTTSSRFCLGLTATPTVLEMQVFLTGFFWQIRVTMVALK